jgi:hypothetical protein
MSEPSLHFGGSERLQGQLERRVEPAAGAVVTRGWPARAIRLHSAVGIIAGCWASSARINPLGIVQVALASAPMRACGTTAGSAPALPQLRHKRQAHRKPFGNLRLAPLMRLQRFGDAFT